jgi:hypothetical protein
MSSDLEALRAHTLSALAEAADLRAWDAIRVGTLGKSGALTTLLKELGKTPPDQRRERGAALNQLKNDLADAIEQRRVALDAEALTAKLAAERMDVTLPPRPEPQGSIHPISRTLEEIHAIFGAMGFSVAEGPDIESDWHNFSALNIPPRATTTIRFTCPVPRLTRRRASYGPTPARCKSAPCWKPRRRSASSSLAVHTVRTTMPPTPRCSTNAKAWPSAATSRSRI